MTTSVPSWAMSHLDKHLPAGNPVVNAHTVRRNLVLANTRLGAVLVQRGFWTGIRHIFLEVPSQKSAFRCAQCSENLQFYNLEIPADVFCSICASKYHVDDHGHVTDAKGDSVAAEFKAKELHPFPPVWDAADKVAGRARLETVASADPDALPIAEPDATDPTPFSAPSPDGPFLHEGYTLYARRTETKGGTRTLWFFSKGAPKSGSPSPLPEGYEVGANQRTGLPYLRKAEAEGAKPARKPARRKESPITAVKSKRKGRKSRG